MVGTEKRCLSFPFDFSLLMEERGENNCKYNKKIGLILRYWRDLSKFAFNMEIRIENIEEIVSAAREFLRATEGHNHIAFHGSMGAGKTTFISALCEALGMEDEATSPTFSIVNEYRGAGRRVYHFDFYRIESPEETLDLGLDDYFDSGALCLMEWPENVEDFLPDDTLDVTIEETEEGGRVIRMDM